MADVTIAGGRARQREPPFMYTDGGGIANGNHLMLRRVGVTGNSAGYGGGIDIRGLATVEILNSTVTQNRSSDGGGGIDIAPATVDGASRDHGVVQGYTPERQIDDVGEGRGQGRDNDARRAGSEEAGRLSRMPGVAAALSPACSNPEPTARSARSGSRL
ncbi:hypothetical protein RKD23_000130 [Streptomyces sp. SAI-170]|uniref:hypothetical protein n=1 Tax=Streptomyces sp. SAI-170 TaxID=3377729 RepID=UPI003C79FC3E